MSNFQLSSNIDTNKVFLRNRSELEGRLDPYFYSGLFKSNIDLIKKNRYKRLKDVVSFSNETWDQKNLFDEYFPYLEISSINLDTGDIRGLDIRKKSDAPSRAKMLIRQGDILVSTTRPTRGAIAHYSDNNIIVASTGFAVIREVDENIINRFYLFYILRLYFSLLQMGQRSSGGNYPAITQEELGNIYIPIPIIKKQIKVVQLLQNSYQLKQQKEQEAQNLLNSIDGYLMDELGIELPEVDNSLESRVFKTSSRKIINNRWDTRYHSYFNLLLEQDFKYEIMSLRDVVNTSPQYGLNDSAINPEKETDIRFVRITDIDNNGNLKSNNWKTVCNPLSQYLLEKNDILFARSGSVGRCYIHQDLSRQAVFAGYLIRFKVITNKANPFYLFYYCNSMFYKKWVEAIERPSVQSNINAQEFMSLPLILPSLREQNKIVAYIQSIREQAKQLQNDAQQQFEEMKKEIERMILGEN